MVRLGVLVYDGDCGFCTRSATWLEHHAGSLAVVPWQRADLASLGLTEAQCQEAVQLVLDGRISSGGRAVALALADCRQPYRAVGRVLGLRAVAPIVERAYRVVAAHRHRLPGGTATCASDRDERADSRPVGDGSRVPVTPADR